MILALTGGDLVVAFLGLFRFLGGQEGILLLGVEPRSLCRFLQGRILVIHVVLLFNDGLAVGESLNQRRGCFHAQSSFHSILLIKLAPCCLVKYTLSINKKTD